MKIQFFQMVRAQGVVADGVIWADGQVTLKWCGEHSSVAHWSDLDHAIAVHGHEGTQFVMERRPETSARVGVHGPEDWLARQAATEKYLNELKARLATFDQMRERVGL